jgi:ubiquitin-like domain-containing CTD phosphatase 1
MTTITKSDNSLTDHLEQASSSNELRDETLAQATEITEANEKSINEETDLTVIIKHGGAEHKIENLLQDHTILYLKSQIEELTNVRVCRQKLFGLKTRSGKPLTDDMTLEETLVTDKMKIMMMGSQEDDIKSIERASRHKLPPLDDDFDLEDDDPISDARIPREPAYHAKIFRRVKHYKIKMLNQPRPNKKLLVLDIDYTLFDHRSTAQTAAELMRPYLHEFLTSAYQDYDIVIWSATSMRYIEAKMNELKVSNNPNYKIVFYLDSGAMISVESQKYGLLNVKPLAVIWGKFPGQYTHKNTIMFDDTRRNFLMNPQNGLKIKAFREAWKNRETDQELFLLSIYLSKIAKLDDFTSLDHKYWQRAIDIHKRHKPSK